MTEISWGRCMFVSVFKARLHPEILLYLSPSDSCSNTPGTLNQGRGGKVIVEQGEWVMVAQLHLTLCNPMDYIACQALLSMKFSRQDYWSGLPFPSPGWGRERRTRCQMTLWLVLHSICNCLYKLPSTLPCNGFAGPSQVICICPLIFWGMEHAHSSILSVYQVVTVGCQSRFLAQGHSCGMPWVVIQSVSVCFSIWKSITKISKLILRRPFIDNMDSCRLLEWKSGGKLQCYAFFAELSFWWDL